MKNEDFFMLYIKPIRDTYADKYSDEDAMAITKDLSDFLKENETLDNEEFKKKAINTYGDIVDTLRSNISISKLSQIRGMLEFFVWITCVSFLIWIIMMIVAASATPHHTYPY